jgi:FkbM family methyltransferase
MKNIIKIPFKFIAYLAEHLPKFRTFLRHFHFKGKVVAVSEINARFLPKGELIETCNGIMYELNLEDDIQKFIYFNVYEHRGIQKVMKYIKTGDICLDIGANVGFYALNFAKHVGKTGKVYAFEPSPDLAQKLKKNIQYNNYESIIEVHQLGICDITGFNLFALSPNENSGWGHLGTDERFNQTITIQTDTLDNFFEEKQINTVKFMKVDIEGAEDKLIEGAKQVLHEKRIDHIYMEFCKMSSIETLSRIEKLASFGYFPEKQDKAILDKMCKDDSFSRNLVQNFLFSCIK